MSQSRGDPSVHAWHKAWRRERAIDLAEGVVAALGFKTAATLLKTLELRSWQAIATFVMILALRTVVKQVLSWEARRLRPNA